jgi:hypothetical protein
VDTHVADFSFVRVLTIFYYADLMDGLMPALARAIGSVGINDMYTHLHFTSGRTIEYHVEPNDLWSAITDLEMGFNRTIYLPGYATEDETFIPLKNLNLLDAPLLDALEGREKELAELEASNS